MIRETCLTPPPTTIHKIETLSSPAMTPESPLTCLPDRHLSEIHLHALFNGTYVLGSTRFPGD